MGKFLARISPELSLRAGLGVMYLYSGIDILRHPTAWFWAVRPLFRWFPDSMRATFTQPEFMKNFLLSQGVIEIVFALILLAWFLPKKYAKYVAGFTALEMAAILLLIPLDAVTFRDFGLLGGALALYLIMQGGFKQTGPSVKQSAPIAERKEGDAPLVQTFDEFIGGKK
jgi:hypothetical protein